MKSKIAYSGIPLEAHEIMPELLLTDPFVRGNTKKDLTILKDRNIMKHVNKLKRKDNKMSKEKSTTKTKGNKRSVLLSVAWLVEAAFRCFVGWLILSNFNNFIATAAGVYALATAAVIVSKHFIEAHK